MSHCFLHPLCASHTKWIWRIICMDAALNHITSSTVSNNQCIIGINKLLIPFYKNLSWLISAFPRILNSELWPHTLPKHYDTTCICLMKEKSGLVKRMDKCMAIVVTGSGREAARELFSILNRQLSLLSACHHITKASLDLMQTNLSIDNVQHIVLSAETLTMCTEAHFI